MEEFADSCLQDEVEEMRGALIEALADVDDEMGEMFLMEEEPTEDDIKCLLR